MRRVDGSRSGLDVSRRRVEAALSDLRESFKADVGLAPRLGYWILPLVGAASGLALVFSLRRGLPKRRDQPSERESLSSLNRPGDA